MKFYFAAANNSHDFSTLLRLDVPRILLSYFDLRKKPELYLNAKDRDVFIDSGAFSAFTRNDPIDIEKYARFLVEHGCTQYANLDAIGDAVQTWKNQEWLESVGLRPLPVWHITSPISNLERILENYTHFAIGGMVPLARQRTNLRTLLDRAWTVIRPKFPVKIHAFGMSARWILLRYPWYSADSSTWLSFRKYGQTQDKSVDVMTAKFRLKTAHKATIAAHEVPNFVHLEREVTELWNLRGIDWRTLNGKADEL